MVPSLLFTTCTAVDGADGDSSMSAPTHEEIHLLLYALFGPGVHGTFEYIVLNRAKAWYRQGKRDGVEEYTTGKIASR